MSTPKATPKEQQQEPQQEEPHPQPTAATGTAASQPAHLQQGEVKDYSDPVTQMDPEEEKRRVKEMEATLPRPDWYSSDDEDSDAEDVIEEEVTEMKAKQENISLILVYTICVFIGFVFNLTSSCPVPWMRAKHGGRTYGVWRAKGGGQPDLKVNNIHDCSNEMQYWQAAASFSVISTVFSAGALVSGICLCVGKGHIGVSLALGFYCMSYSLVSWALVAANLHYHRCGKGTYNSFARLDAGFALTLIAWVLYLVGTLLLLFHFAANYTKSIHYGKPHVYRFFYIVFLCIVLLFWCVGCAYTQWERTFPLVKVKVTIWHIEVYDRSSKLSTFLGRNKYACSTFTRRMKVAAGFNIMSIIFAALGLLCSMVACFNHKQKNNANFLGIVAWVFNLVSWLVLAIMRHCHMCTTPVGAGVSFWQDIGYNGIPSGVKNGQINYKGYKMGEGFALLVTGWALLLIATIINIVIP